MFTRKATNRVLIRVLILCFVGTAGDNSGRALQTAAPTKTLPPKTLRLYVLDCGMLQPTTEGVERYHVTTAEVGETRMPVPCFLIAHPRGTLMWDVGVIPDSIVESQPQGARANVNPTVAATVTRTLKGQLAKIGYAATDITYVAISHAHIDHTANLSALQPRPGSRRRPSATSCGQTTTHVSTRPSIQH